MRVEVRFYGFIRDAASSSSRHFELSDRGSVRELLNAIIDRFGEKLRDRLLTRAGDLETNVQIFVEGERVAEIDRPLADGRGEVEVRVFVLSATAGG
ncbi:MAG TPA: MoaD/ThiS family protein [candidate division Zixibacteria bacterium]|nr:MoaD/ThiS family protein [candidate division Zixibacteria bacterium]